MREKHKQERLILKHYLKQFGESPWPLKVLFTLYLYSLWQQVQMWFRPEVKSAFGSESILVSVIYVVFILGLLALIFLRIRKAWILRLADCLYELILSVRVLDKKSEITTRATD